MSTPRVPPAKTPEVFDHLKACARNMRTITYGELAEATGLASFGIGKQLGYIRDEICRHRRLPWINALAVNAQSMRPGESFLPQGVGGGEDEELFWRGMVLHVYAYNWDAVAFDA